jgi:hypothetical protein
MNPFAALAYFRNLVGRQWSPSAQYEAFGYTLTVSTGAKWPGRA